MPHAESEIRARTRASGWRVLFWLALAVQCYGLYWPDQPGPDLGIPNADKIVHLLIFGAVGFTAVRAFGRPGVVAALLAIHAVASELIQHFVLPGRSGDPKDVAADLTGVVIFVGLATALPRRRVPASS